MEHTASVHIKMSLPQTPLEQYASIENGDTELEQLHGILQLDAGLYHYLRGLCIEAAAYDDPRATYIALLDAVQLLYKLCKRECFEKERQTVNALMESFWRLDECCGVSEDVMKRCFQYDMSAILLLDKDRDCFRAYLKEGMQKLQQHEPAINTLTMFAECVFRFNNYQPPWRGSDKQKAIEDAQGMTDVFGEFLACIEDELKQ